MEGKWSPPRGAPKLCVAAHEGNVEVVKQLINEGKDVNEVAGRGEACWPFTIACSAALSTGASPNNVHRKCAELLARAGADVNRPLLDGRTALMTAGKRGTFQVDWWL